MAGLSMSAINERTGRLTPVKGFEPAGAMSQLAGGLMNLKEERDREKVRKARRIFVKYGADPSIPVPRTLFDSLHEVLDPLYPDWRSVVSYSHIIDPLERAGNVYQLIWFNGEDYYKHWYSDIRIVIGRYVNYPEFHGTWYYFKSSEEVLGELIKRLGIILITRSLIASERCREGDKA
jgi:hypothetical protein